MVDMANETGPGRPRKWANNTERMRAYRARERERRDPLRGDHTTAELTERVVELTSERDRLWTQVVRLQQHIAQLENALAGHRTLDTPAAAPAATSPHSGLSRAERRRLEREQQRHR